MRKAVLWIGMCLLSTLIAVPSLDAQSSIGSSSSVVPYRRPEVASYTVTVTTSGDAVGRVDAKPTIVDNSVLRNPKRFSAGATVRLKAVPGKGAVFAGWSGGCTGKKPTCALRIRENVEVAARFDWKNATAAQRMLTVSVVGGAGGVIRSSPPGIECGGGKTACSAMFFPFTRVTLTAAPMGVATFSGWSGGCAGREPSCSLFVTTTTAVTAGFSAAAVPLTVFPIGPGKGRVISDPPGIACIVPGTDLPAGSCAMNVPAGTVVRFKGMPQKGSTVGVWIEGNKQSAATEYAVTALTMTSLKVRFDDLSSNALQAVASQRCSLLHGMDDGFLCLDPGSYQICRTHLLTGAVGECQGDFTPADMQVIKPASGQYTMGVQSDTAVTVFRGRRGEGQISGSATLTAQFAVPVPSPNPLCNPAASAIAPGDCAQACQYRDDVVIVPNGKEGGVVTIVGDPVSGKHFACDAPLLRTFSPNEDDLRRAYDLCDADNLWGKQTKTVLRIRAGARFTFKRPITELTDGAWSVTDDGERIQPTLTVQAPLGVRCAQ